MGEGERREAAAVAAQQSQEYIKKIGRARKGGRVDNVEKERRKRDRNRDKWDVAASSVNEDRARVVGGRQSSSLYFRGRNFRHDDTAPSCGPLSL